MMRKGVWVMCTADTVMNGDSELRSDAEPEGAGGSDVGRVTEAMGEEFLDSGEGLESNSTLGGFREVLELERVGDGNGVGVDSAFDSGVYQVAEEDGDGIGWDGWDV